MDEILEILEKNGRHTPGEIATMLGKSEAEVKSAIADYEAKHIITGYPALINWDKTDQERVTALIEVNTASGHDHCFQTVRDGATPFRSWTRRGLYSGGSWTWSARRASTSRRLAPGISCRSPPPARGSRPCSAR